MMMNRTVFKLKVKQVGTVCDFELSWGQGQTISVELNYSLSLMTGYEQWQRAYLNYYKRLRGSVVINGTGTLPVDRRKRWSRAYLNYYRRLRGQVVISGTGTRPVDRHKELKNAEEKLLDEFQHWLLSPELASIRRQIVKAAKSEHHTVEVCLTCTPIELARLPWETWDIGMDLGTPQQIRLVRTPANIVHKPVYPIRRKARVLAILGDNTGLNLGQDTKALESLLRVASITIIGWKRNQENADVNILKSIESNFFEADTLKNEIANAIADKQGWDILFFAGHSNETVLTGGELGIAPHTSISIQDIEQSLHKAKQRGLQFAIFNSCSGINIAQSLINLGLSQVAVMREPIHDQVAQEFLVQFLKSLAEYKDVHEALLDASQFLKQEEKRLSYPSAYLVPSLFRHPGAELFRIKPFGLVEALKRWLPTKPEASWLVALLFLSLLPPVQSLLLEPRILLQAVYRYTTFQVPAKAKSPVWVLSIDEESIKADTYRSDQVSPIDYSYLAALLNRLSQLKAKVVGIDYVLDDKQQPNNSLKLKQSVNDTVGRGTWLVFASGEGENTRRAGVSKTIASLNWSLEGDISFFPWYVQLLPIDTSNSEIYPFAYLLAVAYRLNQESPPNLPPPNLRSPNRLNASVINYLNREKPPNQTMAFLEQVRFHPLSKFSQNFLQQWLSPIIDFSIPPDSAYERLSTCKLLGECQGKGTVPNDLKNDVVVIIPGGYKGPGFDEKTNDNFTVPMARGFWRGWSEKNFPGGEAHAYMLHHLLTQRLVVPIPDLWIILLAALLGKGMTLVLQDNLRQQRRWMLTFGMATAIYAIASLQFYISVAVLLPWFLPSVVFWNYIRLALRRRFYGSI